MARRILIAVLLSACLASWRAEAADPTPETGTAPLHVIRPILHADQEQAELCLEFDHALDAAGGLARVAAALHLESDGKTVAVSSKNLSLGGNQVCLSPLEHRRNYRLVFNPLRDAKGERLSHPYSLSFTMPARRASLVFVAEESRKEQDRVSPDG